MKKKWQLSQSFFNWFINICNLTGTEFSELYNNMSLMDIVTKTQSGKFFYLM